MTIIQCKKQQFHVHTNMIMKIKFFFARLRVKLRVLEKRGGQVPILKLQLSRTIVSTIFRLWGKLAHTSLVKIMLNVN